MVRPTIGFAVNEASFDLQNLKIQAFLMKRRYLWLKYRR